MHRSSLSLVFLAACAAPAAPSIPPLSIPTPLVGPTVAAPAPATPSLAPAEVRALQSSILGGHGAFDAVSSLTTEVGARLAGSPADKLAVAWALRVMKDRGLVNVHAEPVKVPVWRRGVETASIVLPIPHSLMVTALGWSGATPPGGVVADVVSFESLAALEAADAHAVAGRIVFLDVKLTESFGYGEAVPARSRGPGAAAKKGAVAIVIRSIGTDTSRFPHTGAMHREKDERSALPAAALSNADADLLERVLAAHGSARLSLVLTPRWLPEAESANVVGEIPGSERPDEVVLLGAHLDSWDLAEGAIDDGAGDAIVLEAGRALASLAHKPRRTVRVVLFAAEENSLSGGTEYARLHVAEAPKLVAAMEADSGTGRVLRAELKEAQKLPLAASSLEPLGIQVVDREGHGGADIGPLQTLGVPPIDLEQDPARYFDTHHTANDVLERIDGAALSQSAAAFATMAWLVASLEGELRAAPPTSQRAAR